MGTKIGLVLVCKVLKLLNKYSFFKIKLNRSCKDDFADSIKIILLIHMHVLGKKVLWYTCISHL